MVDRADIGSSRSTPRSPTTSDPGTASPVYTFLIADVRGYSTFTRERGDAAAAVLAKKFADLARDAVEARSGRVVELRGDEAFAVFGTTALAVRAAVELQATFAEESRVDPAFQLPVGMGIDAGEAVPVEEGYRGVAVNMAARLCSSAAAGQVLVTRTVTDRVDPGSGMAFADRGLATFKGFEEPVEVIEALALVGVRGESPVPNEAPSLDRVVPPELDPMTPLVDREREMRWLRGTWRQVRRGHGRLLLVSGPAQIGKTRLAGEFAAHVAGGGGDVQYSGPGGAAAALALAAIRDVIGVSVPTLLVLDDIDVAGAAVAEALATSYGDVSDHAVLVLGLIGDPAASPELTSLVERADVDGDGHRVLRPFELDDVRGIVRLYLGDAEREAPVESFARASGGVPGRVHEVVSDWTRTEASRRLEAAAEYLATGRERHASDLEFANNAIALKLGRLYTIEGRDVLASEACPYKGLAQFVADDSEFFFGRERLVGELAARTVGTGFLGVVGASGSGKSSAIAAGLIPSLEAGLLPGSERWTHISFRPGEHPMDELRQALSSEVGEPLESAIVRLPDDGRLVLVVDQFEETFTTCIDEAERGAFIQALTSASQRWPDRIAIIAAIRGDFYAQCAAYPDLAGLLSTNNVLAGPLARDELRRAIELPARRAGLRIESALTDALVEDVADEPGGLPLLSTALVELWRAREHGWIRMDSYERTGGVRGAVARLAEASYAELSDLEQEAARRVFLRLLIVGEDEAISKRRVALDEFDLDRDEAAAGVIARLTQDRLLTMSEGTVEVAHEALLREWPRLRGWLEDDVQGRQLHLHLMEAAREWTSGGRDPADLYRGARLASAMDWTAEHTIDLNEQERAFLEGSREATQREIERTRRTNRRLRAALIGVALFLVVALVGGTLALQQRARARDAARISDSKRLAAQAVAGQDVGQSLRLALAGLSIDDSVDTRSALLQVLQRAPTLIGGINTDIEVSDVAMTPDGQTLVGNAAGSIEFFKRHQGVGPSVGDLDAGADLAIDPGGRTIAMSGTKDGLSYVVLVDAKDKVVAHQIEFPSRVVLMSLAFSPDGRRVAVADWRGGTSPRRIDFIDRESGKEAGSLIVGRLSADDEAGTSDDRHYTAMEYLPGDRLAVSWFTGGVFEGGTTIWDLRSRRPVMRFGVGGAALAVSPDGEKLAVGQLDGGVSVIDLKSGKTTAMKSPHSGPVTDVAFTADGNSVLSSGTDGQIKDSDIETAALRAALPGAGHLAVSRDGRTLYSTGPGSAIYIWDLSGQRGLAHSVDIGGGYPQFDINPANGIVAYQLPGGGGILPPRHIGLWDPATGAVSAVPAPSRGQTCYAAFSPDGDLVLERCDGHVGWRTNTNHPSPSIALWSLKSRTWIGGILRASGGAVWGGAFSPDGRSFATASDDYFPAPNAEASARTSTVIVWDVASMHPLSRYHLRGSAELNDGAVFSPDGHFLAAATGGINDSRVWDLRTHGVVCAPEGPGGHQDEVRSMAFSPDSTTLAIATTTGMVRFLNISSRTCEDEATAITGTGSDPSIAYSPDGTLFAVDNAGQVSLWDIASGRQLGTAYSGPLDNQTGSIRFLPDGTIVLLTAYEPAFLFSTDIGSWRTQACSIVGDVAPYRWQEMAPAESYRSVC